MKRKEKKEQCCGCGACAQVCPKNCIVMKPDREGFPYPETAGEGCISCGLCEKVCPVPEKMPRGNSVPGCCVGYAEDEEIRACSSSGGVFSLLAGAVLGSGGHCTVRRRMRNRGCGISGWIRHPTYAC